MTAQNSMNAGRIRQRRLSAAIALFAATVAGTQAATITVNSADDDAGSSFCNLRDALTSINSGNTASTMTCAAQVTGSFGSDDTVVFDASLVNSTITLSQGELRVGMSKKATIVGSGQTIDAAGQSSGLYLNQYANVTASELTVTGGSANKGGGINLNWYASLTLDRCTVSNNSAALGGGIALAPFSGVRLNASTVTGNTSSSPGAGVYMAPGSGLQMMSSTLSSNTANCGVNSGCGAGIHLTRGYLIVTDSTIEGNAAYGHDRLAGAVYLGNSHIATFSNATIVGNKAVGNDYMSGGVWQLADPVGQLTLTNSTITSNSAVGGIHGSGGVASGVTATTGLNGTLVLANSIVSNNAFSAPDLLVGGGTSSVSVRYNLLGTALNITPFNNAADHNVFSDSPALGPLQNNGGATPTMALLTGSPALRAGSVALATYFGQPLAYDQRGIGYPRTFSGTVDIGAFEDQGDRIFGTGEESLP